MMIFLSYASQDEELASRLADQLALAGFAVWAADKDISPGENWAAATARALEQADAMVAIITSKALQSQNLSREIQFALTSKQYEHRLVPVLVDYATFEPGTDVPWILLKMNPVYVGRSSGFEQVVDRIHEIAQQESNAPC